MTKWIVVFVVVSATLSAALAAAAFDGFGRKMVTIAWDRNPAATSYNCYLDGTRVATHVSSDVLRCTFPVSFGLHTVGVTSVAGVQCGARELCDVESPPASLHIVTLPFVKPFHLADDRPQDR